MVPRQLFLELDGFSYRYEPAYYEDTNFCMALADSGYRVILATRAVCVHLEGASTVGLDHWRASQRSNRQRRLFASSWRPRLTRARVKAMTIEQSNHEQSDSAFSGEGSDASRIDASREELLQRIDPSLLSTLAGGNGPWSLCRLRQLAKNGASWLD
jgi:hypothetical protein